MAISTNPKPTIYRNLYENAAIALSSMHDNMCLSNCSQLMEDQQHSLTYTGASLAENGMLQCCVKEKGLTVSQGGYI